MDSKGDRTMRRALRKYVLLGLAMSTVVGMSLVGLGWQPMAVYANDMWYMAVIWSNMLETVLFFLFLCDLGTLFLLSRFFIAVTFFFVT